MYAWTHTHTHTCTHTRETGAVLTARTQQLSLGSILSLPLCGCGSVAVQRWQGACAYICLQAAGTKGKRYAMKNTRIMMTQPMGKQETHTHTHTHTSKWMFSPRPQ